MNANRLLRSTSAAAVLTLLAGAANAQVITTPTMDPATLRSALPASGLTIDAVIIKTGMPGQFGVFERFNLPPVTIRNGIVLSSGDVTNLAPFPEASLPDYDPASPPPQVNSQMTPEASGGTPEFDAYGSSGSAIENFYGSYDVAALEVHFSLVEDSAVKFDFIFGSVEYPFWTSQFTDAFLVFLDDTNPSDQIAFDATGSAVQVGSSFAGLTLTADLNTAFSNPHGLIHHLTTTTPVLESGEHVLTFEVGDVNDHILDSAVFITNLRTGVGSPGTKPSDDPPCNPGDDPCNPADITDIGDEDAEPDGQLTLDDILLFVNEYNDSTGCPGPAPCNKADITDIGDSGAGPDGLLTLDDILAFVNAYNEGC